MKGNGVLKKRVTQALLGMGILALLGSAALAGWIFVRLPSPDDLSAYTTAPSSKIHDRNGQLLFEMPPPYTGSHTPVTLADIPQHLIWATIATEDATFYDNPGMDFKGILRAVWINAQGGEVLAGGSTITQQLVRTVMFGADERAERTLRRKLRELALAVRITRRYSKDAILTLYLNETYYGNRLTASRRRRRRTLANTRAIWIWRSARSWRACRKRRRSTIPWKIWTPPKNARLSRWI